MSSDLQRLRAEAERYKSFPLAVAAVVGEMYDRGAQRVDVAFKRDRDDRPVLEFRANREVFSLAELQTLTSPMSPSRFTGWWNVFVHHGMSSCVSQRSYEIIGLGEGEGVNARQDRSAARLLRALPALLSPRETYCTFVFDEKRTEYPLVWAPPQSAKANGFEVSIPEKFIWVGDNGLVIKFGAVRVPIATLLSRAKLVPARLERLAILAHPWLRGVMEVEVRDESQGIPIPIKSAENFDSEDFGDWDMATTLANALLFTNMPEVVASRIGKVIDSALSDFCERGELLLGRHTYSVRCADPFLTDDVSDGRLVIYENPNSPDGMTEFLVDATHPVFRTVHPMDEEVMQVIWWQLAHWIAVNRPRYLHDVSDTIAQANAIYLALREQNPARGYDDE